MASGRPFAYNTGSSIGGTEQVGDLAVGLPSGELTGLPSFWNGPDEELGYVIAYSQPDGLHPTSNKIAWDSNYVGAGNTLSSGNTIITNTGVNSSVLGNRRITSPEKVMFSIRVNYAITGGSIGFGLQDMDISSYIGGDDAKSIGFSNDGDYLHAGTIQDSGLPTWGSVNDVVDVALDLNVGIWWIRVNNGNWNGTRNENPAAGTGSVNSAALNNLYPAVTPFPVNIQGRVTILSEPLYSVPSGFQFLGDSFASLGFWRSKTETDEDFLDLVKNKTGQTFATGDQAKTWLNDNGYWTSYLPFPSSVLSLDAADYTSGAWIDSVGGKSFTLYNSPTWSSSNGGYFSFNAASAQHAICSSSLPNLNTWSVAVWHYYTGINTGAAPCIVTETFPGNTSNINYSLGNNNTPLSSGFFDGAWRTTSLAGELQQNNWYYIVGTYDGATLKAYVNDSLISSVSYTGTPISSQGGIRLMRRWDLADYWGGRLATVDIYSEAIGSDQISSIFNATKSRFGL
jgi:hypothetical protein